MRYFLLLLSLGLLFGVAAAGPLPTDTAAVRINKLPANGLLLSKGWRYHAGDNPAWARPGFDASAWDTITVARAGVPLPLRARAGAGWFRLRLRLTDSLRVQALGLTLSQSLAGLEVYADGRRIGGSGVFSTDPARVQAAGSIPSPLDLVAVGPSPYLVLAVRFAPWQPPLQLRPRMAQHTNLDFGLRLQKQQVLRREQQQWQGLLLVDALLGGWFLLLCLLHLAFYCYNPAQRANAYFAMYALVGAAHRCLSAFHPTGLGLWTDLVVTSAALFFYIFGFVAGLRALYALFEERPGWVYTGFCLAACLLIPWIVFYGFVSGSSVNLYFSVVIILLTLMQLRLTWRAVRQRRRGSLLVGSGFGIGLLLVLVSVALYDLFPQWWASDFFDSFRKVLFSLASVAPALSISLLLAREFAQDAQLLQVKLGEVKQLSAQTLAQEQEKQALLAAQNETLETQVTQRTGELQRSLTELRGTQAQLIQKEKMASLGELMAGIAHEIQNPLNFVNNFSEVSTELLEELEEEQAKPTRDAGLETELLGDLKQNLGKITHHGRRAAAIVKGMLEHSRTSTGERAPTDLNQLADEYLRLAYQGLRAKDKSFNATLKTDFATDLPEVNAVAGDLGRVLLNLFSNAFYAVQQRQQTGEAGYAPTISVSTQRENGRVAIRVTDNGTGMPAEVKAKIFQPFFTTKPTGEGTGLGLSLSHDIIAQGHGGTLTVESREGEGTAFCMMLP